jgi:branched-chain amino acid transport system ATP-binding protein
MSLLEVRDLRVAYGHVEAVRGVSFSVGKGEIVALIGPNGAGKSSTLNAIGGLLKPASGSVLLEGKELAGAPAHKAVAAGIVLVPEGRAILQRMTVAENLLIGSEARPWSRDEARAAIAAQLKRFPSLQRRVDQPAGALSGGLLVRQIFDIIKEIHQEGTTILLVEQNARMALQVAQHACVLERGQVALKGPAAELARDQRLQAAYLGGDVA